MGNHGRSHVLLTLLLSGARPLTLSYCHGDVNKQAYGSSDDSKPFHRFGPVPSLTPILHIDSSAQLLFSGSPESPCTAGSL